MLDTSVFTKSSTAVVTIFLSHSDVVCVCLSAFVLLPTPPQQQFLKKKKKKHHRQLPFVYDATIRDAAICGPDLAGPARDRCCELRGR